MQLIVGSYLQPRNIPDLLQFSWRSLGAGTTQHKSFKLVLKTFKLCRCLFSFLDQFFKQTCFSLFLFIASVFSTWNSFTACFMLFRTRYFTEPSKHPCGFFPMVFDGKPSHFSPGVSIASYVSYLHY